MANEYPHVYELFQYNFDGTWKYLKANGVLRYIKLHPQPFGVSYGGNDSRKTWIGYKKAIEKYFKDTNNEDRLKTAREAIANKIITQHFNTFPYWPSVAEYRRTAIVDITTHIEYKYDDEYIVYKCQGSIQITYTRASENEFIAAFQGQPTLEQVFIDLPLLKRVDTACEQNWNLAKTEVDMYT